MKTLGFTAIFSALLFFSCKKDSSANMVNATITGPDYGMCLCCGGTFIVIGDSIIGATTYRIETVPPSSGIDLQNGPFPIDVQLTYYADTIHCAGMYIISNDIRRR